MSIIKKEVTIAASVDLVWWAWTKPERITAWFAPVANIDAKVGGAFELFFDPANKGHMNTAGCTFTVVEPKSRLSFTWKGPDDVMNDVTNLTKVDVHFHEEDGITRVVVEHSGWEEAGEGEKAINWHQMAWDQVLGSLKSALESGEGQICCAPEDAAEEVS